MKFGDGQMVQKKAQLKVGKVNGGTSAETVGIAASKEVTKKKAFKKSADEKLMDKVKEYSHKKMVK